MTSETRITDGSWEFSGGVDSGKVVTLKSALVENGLARNQNAWLKNATCRGGGISPRAGWKKLCRVAAESLYQGGYLYDASALASANMPYLMLSIAGRIYQVRVDTDNSVVDISAVSGLTNPATEPQGYMCQGEEFLVIQAGDYTTLPLFWDGASLRRSGSLVPTELAGGTFTVPALSDYAIVTLPAPYAGQVNQIFNIDGYTYMQVDPNQCYSVQFNNITFTSPASLTISANNIFPSFAGAPPEAKLLAYRVLLALDAGVKNDTRYLLEDTAITALDQYKYTVAGFSSWRATFTPTPIALGVNEVAIVNVDDPRFSDLITVPAVGTTNEIPAAGPMDYYMGRIWFAYHKSYIAGDIVGGTAGTAPYNFRDSILKVTENPVAFGGDAFAVPSNSGDITAIAHTSNLDSALGDGPLFIGTRKSIYKLTVPVTRDDWINATSNNQPLQTVAQQSNGMFGDRGVVTHNGDLFYQSTDGIRSLILALRYFGQWGNTPISGNVERCLGFNDATLMSFSSGVVFDNRLLQTCLPIETACGVAFRGIVSLDFDLVSSLAEKLPPAWEGMLEGLKVLQLFAGNFNGEERCFAVVVSEEDGGIDVWELTKEDKTDDADKDPPLGDKRIIWYAETPCWTWSRDLEMKQLDGGEIFLDRIFGTVDIEVHYRVDADPCWQFWYRTQLCTARTSCEDVNNPVCYPEQPYRENNLFPLVLPTPPTPACQSLNRRPMTQGYQFQMRIAVKGFCRIRGILVHALTLGRAPFTNIRG